MRWKSDSVTWPGENLIQTRTKEWGKKKKVKNQIFISINNPKQAKDTSN